MISCRYLFTICLSLLGTMSLAAAQESEWSTDRVVLDNGSIFEGRVVAETEKALTLRVTFGGTLDLAKHRIASREELEPTADTVAETRTEWFRLHDRFGTQIGTRRVVERDGDFQRIPCRVLEEILHLTPEDGPTLHIIWQEYLSPSGQVLAFFYREAEGERERTMRGDFEPDGRILIEEVRNGRRDHRRESWPESRWLPLSYRMAGEAAPAACRVWDPRRGGDLVWKRRAMSERVVDLEGYPVTVRRSAIERAEVSSIRWVDSESGEIVLEELQGCDLRAMRWRPAAEAATELAPIRHLELGYYDGLQRIAAFAPHPGWMVRLPARRADEVITVFDRHTGAEIQVIRPKWPKEHAAVAETLARSIAGPGSVLERQFETEYRNRSVNGAVCSFGEERIVRTLVWEWDGGPIAIVFIARRSDLPVLGEDFDRFLARLRCGEL
ncbi:MAG: hypothetical protein RL885_29690 [Planctomycetota bacterium]